MGTSGSSNGFFPVFWLSVFSKHLLSSFFICKLRSWAERLRHAFTPFALARERLHCSIISGKINFILCFAILSLRWCELLWSWIRSSCYVWFGSDSLPRRSTLPKITILTLENVSRSNKLVKHSFQAIIKDSGHYLWPHNILFFKGSECIHP